MFLLAHLFLIYDHPVLVNTLAAAIFLGDPRQGLASEADGDERNRSLFAATEDASFCISPRASFAPPETQFDGTGVSNPLPPPLPATLADAVDSGGGSEAAATPLVLDEPVGDIIDEAADASPADDVVADDAADPGNSPTIASHCGGSGSDDLKGAGKGLPVPTPNSAAATSTNPTGGSDTMATATSTNPTDGGDTMATSGADVDSTPTAAPEPEGPPTDRSAMPSEGDSGGGGGGGGGGVLGSAGTFREALYDNLQCEPDDVRALLALLLLYTIMNNRGIYTRILVASGLQKPIETAVVGDYDQPLLGRVLEVMHAAADLQRKTRLVTLNLATKLARDLTMRPVIPCHWC
jgi:hypothetical protein